MQPIMRISAMSRYIFVILNCLLVSRVSCLWSGGKGAMRGHFGFVDGRRPGGTDGMAESGGARSGRRAGHWKFCTTTREIVRKLLLLGPRRPPERPGTRDRATEQPVKQNDDMTGKKRVGTECELVIIPTRYIQTAGYKCW